MEFGLMIMKVPIATANKPSRDTMHLVTFSMNMNGHSYLNRTFAMMPLSSWVGMPDRILE
jgi:hypothetical protein